jgi:hypothetical protein
MNVCVCFVMFESFGALFLCGRNDMALLQLHLLPRLEGHQTNVVLQQHDKHAHWGSLSDNYLTFIFLGDV